SRSATRLVPAGMMILRRKVVTATGPSESVVSSQNCEWPWNYEARPTDRFWPDSTGRRNRLAESFSGAFSSIHNDAKKQLDIGSLILEFVFIEVSVVPWCLGACLNVPTCRLGSVTIPPNPSG
ncbi:MAG: hypothetical protein ACN6Q5_25775, partial [Pseudomonas sp.]|uniref:hypothetical protein n=1 Tax=Pseudomonas sp. TaxID=306 RepID=UPI003D0C502F